MNDYLDFKPPSKWAIRVADIADAAREPLLSEIDHLTQELAEAKARAVPGQAENLLRDLVEALDGAFISSWQSTAGWQSQLDAARDWLSVRPDPKEPSDVE